jgi:hypothetical protein
MRRSGFVTPRRAFLVSAAAAAAAMAACTPYGTPCAGRTCATGYECTANVCDVAGVDPVLPSSERRTLDARSFAVLGRHRDRAAGTAILGSETAGESALYLSFGAVADARHVARAFLVLTPSDHGRGNGADVPLDLWVVPRSWPLGAPARPPGPPQVSAIARTLGPVRFDVTRVVRALGARGAYGRDDSFVVLAGKARGPGVAIATGALTGAAPRLELYFEPRASW